MSNFWQQLKKPIFCLAPMEEVTDFAFREMFARYSGNGQQGTGNGFVMFTEFINTDGLTHPEGYKKLAIDLKYSENQRPIVAQIWGNRPEKFLQAAKIAADLGFDGVDINMGCPQQKEIGLGACAALIRQPKLAQEIILATKEGAVSAGRRMPVSVKTRLGYSKSGEMAGWVENLLSCGIAALTLHARTKQEMSKVPANWEKIKEAVEIRNQATGNRQQEGRTLIIGNGDIKSREEGLKRIQETGCDGVMVARGAFGHPWFFRNDGYQLGAKERLRVMLEHAELFNQELGQYKSFVIMRKHFKAYCSGFSGAHELRAKLMETKSFEETKSIVAEYLKTA
ncbi:MAG: tRNA-dihydrouridine synthase [Patescibacteria group bacterium]|nr:tRNA-dihydrouridine synthase [Patescibacteria group bacterium]